jgi:FxsC-like protein
VPLFFFSYSRDDAGDAYLNRFYEDLRNEVSIRGGIEFEETGFRDLEQPPGVEWPRTTGDALGSCGVFVPVYSPKYFNSPICGKEWSAFSSRLAARPPGGRTRSIAPVWWAPPVAELPPVAQYLQDTRDQFGAEYREHGLRSLMQLSSNKDRYQEFLIRFSMELIAVAAEAPPQRQIADLLSLPNAFATGSSDIRFGQPRHAPGGGPRKVTFVVAATGREEMAGIRTALDVYGEDWADWRPYHPDCRDPVAVRAQGVAAAQRMISGLVPADDSFRALLRAARERSELVVLIVDPWVAALPSFQPLLEDADNVRTGHAVVLAPWESSESLPDSERDQARDVLYVYLGNWMDAGDHAFRDDIRSIADFEKVLGQTLVEVRARIINRAAVAHRVTENGPRSRPILTGPEG